MYIYLDKQGIVKEIINDEALRQSASNVNEIYVYYDGLQENDIGSVLVTYGLPDGTITDEMEVATRTEESEIPYNAERDLKYFQYYKAYAFYHFAIADLALSQEGVVRLMVRLAQKDGEYIKVAGLICFDVEGELIKEDHGVSLAQYNYLVKAWVDTKECLPLDGSKAMRADLDMASHSVLLNGKALKGKNGALNYNGKDLAKQEDVTPLQVDVASLKQDNTKNKSDIVGLQSQIDTINATQNVVDIVGTKAELNAYATKDLHANDKIEVLADESQSNANTIYEWNGNAWSLVGSKAPYYSKAESDARYNELKAKSYDKDTTGYVTGHVPDSALVKGSLDSVNENIGALQTDNQTTKTTIAGLVSSDTQNKEDIATLKTKSYDKDATLDDLTQGHVPDSNVVKGISVDVKAQKQMLDTIGDEVIKSVKTDTDASLKSLTLPSAKDLKTKDGSTFEGEDIPTLTITSENDKLYFTQESLMLIKERMQKKMPLGKFLLGNPDEGFSLDCIAYEMVHISKIEGLMEESVIFPLLYNLGGINSYSVNVVNLTTGEITQNNIDAYPGFSLVNNSLSLGDDTFAGYTPSLQINTINGIPAIQKETSQNIKVQSTLYRHTTTLHNATNTAYFTFSIDKTTQAEITKDTLFNVLNGYIAVGTGIVQNMLIDKISFHNTAEKTKVHQYASFGASGYVNAEVTFASVFGTDYTLEDLVQNP